MNLEKLAHLKPEYRERLLERIAQKRKQREEDELREDENIPMYQDIAHLIKPNIESTLNSMPNYTSKKVGQRVWMTIEGHSMTCKDERISIPDGSRILVRRLPNDPKAIPLNKSLIIIWKSEGEIKSYCKTVSDVYPRHIWCVSLNPDPYYEPFTVRLKDIIEIFEVEKVSKLEIINS